MGKRILPQNDHAWRAELTDRQARFCEQYLIDLNATEAALRAVLLLFNLLSEFQRAAGLPDYRAPATIRMQVLTCGAVLGRAGRHSPPRGQRVGSDGPLYYPRAGAQCREGETVPGDCRAVS